MAGLIAVGWLVFHPLAVVTACLAVATGDFRNKVDSSPGRYPTGLARGICARFTYAWGAWKLAAAALALMFVFPVPSPRPRGKGKRTARGVHSVGAVMVWAV